MSSREINKTKSQFYHISKYINRLLVTHEWDKLGKDRQIRLIALLNSLYKRLCQYISAKEMKRILAAAMVLIGISTTSSAQVFAPPAENPFGFAPPPTSLLSPGIADLDNDGDQDLLFCSYEGNFFFYRNTGTPDTAEFSSSLQNPFGLSSVNEGAFLAIGDLDDDGDNDIILGASDGYLGHIMYYNNSGNASIPMFDEPVTDPFGISTTNLLAIPALADIDQDGDLDIFATEYLGRMMFFENTGTPANPQFATAVPNPFGITPAYGFGSPAFADMDQDGDLDLLEGEYYGNTRFFRNIGTPAVPAFDVPLTNPLGLTQTEMYSFPALADMDNDGDQDVVIMEYYGVMQYFKNIDLNIGVPENVAAFDFELFPNPAGSMAYVTFNEIGQSSVADLCITGMNGGVIKKQRLQAGTNRISLEGIPPGTYLVRIDINGKSSARKLVIR